MESHASLHAPVYVDPVLCEADEPCLSSSQAKRAKQTISWAHVRKVNLKLLISLNDDTICIAYSQVWHHKLGSLPGDDKLVYEEVDDSMYISIHRSRSDKMLLIQAGKSHRSFIPVIERLLGCFLLQVSRWLYT